jgi:drug/metabolite transporter (DMT)-like permease
MRDEKSDPVSYAIIFHFLIGILNLIFALIHGFQIPALNATLFLFIFASILWGAGTIFLFKSLKLIEASEVTIIGTSKSLVTIVGSVIFLGEIFNLQRVFGTVIILIAVFFASKVESGLKFNKGVIFTLTMSLLYGSAIVVDAFIVRTYDPVSYLALSNLLVGILLILFSPKKIVQIKNTFDPNFIEKMFPLSVLSSLQAIAFYVALAMGNHVSQMGIINQAQVIITVLLAVIFLKEKDHLFRKLLAGILATFGIILLK